LAGVPAEVVNRARKILEMIETEGHVAPKVSAPHRGSEDAFDMLSAIARSEAEEAADLIRATDLNTLTPIEAINLIYELKKIVKSEEIR
jgi:DNA mismatch repair protein MutS